jgi:CNT family concentrative nucleoside transporter
MGLDVPETTMNLGLNLISALGIVLLCGIAWLGSEDRSRPPWRVIAWGIGIQFVLALLVFTVPPTRILFSALNNGVNAVLDSAEAGSRFVFGSLLVPNPTITPGPVLAGRWIARALTSPYVPIPGDRLSPDHISLGYIFAFRALPSVIFFSSFIALLYHLRVIQPIINFFARLFCRSMYLSGAESLSGAANIFVGIESVLVVRPFLSAMTRSELCTILASGMGSIASTVLALYSSILRPVFPGITGHLISASFMAIPACFVMSKLLVPERELPQTLGSLPPEIDEDSLDTLRISPMDSVIEGAMEGVKLAVTIAAILIAVLGLVSLVNLVFLNFASLAQSPNVGLQFIGNFFQVVSIQNILGVFFLPLTFCLGISFQWTELWAGAVLLGQRVLETEIPAYLQLANLSNQGVLSHRALLILSYALCGFTHIPSVGIFVGGLVGLVPQRKSEIVEIGWKALWAATLATLMIGCMAGLFDIGNPAILGL